MNEFTFWAIAVILLLVGMAFVLFPLLRPRQHETTVTREEINKSIYYGKVEELQADLDKGLLDQDEYDFALADLQQTLLQDAEITQDQPVFQKTYNNLPTTVVMLVALPLTAFYVYDQVSTGPFTNSISDQQSANAQMQPQNLETAIIRLQERLKNKPNDIDGWKMLGQSYFVVQQYELAKQAYLKALDLVNQSDPDLLVQVAESSAFSNNEKFFEYEKSLLKKALAINPGHEKALWYSGYAAYTNEDYDNAVMHWEKLLQLVPADRPQVKQSLLQFLNDARQRTGQELIAQQGESQNEIADVQQRTIQASVQLNQQINEQANSRDTLFIYARPVQGPKMPLSLARMTVASLPVTVTLSKEMAMVPNMTIESFDQVEVLARISKSGQATTQKGDLISTPVVVDFNQSNTARVALDINKIVE